jgi:hypothetical protein
MAEVALAQDHRDAVRADDLSRRTAQQLDDLVHATRLRELFHRGGYARPSGRQHRGFQN